MYDSFSVSKTLEMWLECEMFIILYNSEAKYSKSLRSLVRWYQYPLSAMEILRFFSAPRAHVPPLPVHCADLFQRIPEKGIQRFSLGAYIVV